MGVMTLALSAFSIVPMAISFVHREFLSQVVTHMRREFKDDEQNGGKISSQNELFKVSNILGSKPDTIKTEFLRVFWVRILTGSKLTS